MMLASKLGIENELYVHLTFSVGFYCPLEGWGYVRAVFRYASGENLKITFNVYDSVLHISLRLLHIFITPWDSNFEPILSGVKNLVSCIFCREHYVSNTSSILPVQYRSGCSRETDYSY